MLENLNIVCYNTNRQKDESIYDDTQTKALSIPSTEGFLFRFDKVAYSLG